MNEISRGAKVAAAMRDGPDFKQGWSFANALTAVAELELFPGTYAPEPPVIEMAMLARDAVLAVLRDHIPSITDEIEEELIALQLDTDSDVSDLALRVCHCGERVDGFYEYVSHLRKVFNER